MTLPGATFLCGLKVLWKWEDTEQVPFSALDNDLHLVDVQWKFFHYLNMYYILSYNMEYEHCVFESMQCQHYHVSNVWLLNHLHPIYKPQYKI